MAIYLSNQTGLWSAASTWLTAAAPPFSTALSAGEPPQSFGGDKIIIRNGHIVTYDVVGCFGDEKSTWTSGALASMSLVSANAIILSAATLSASRTSNIELTARGTIYIASSGTFDWGTTADPLISSANIVLHYMAPYGNALGSLSASAGAAGLYQHAAGNENQPHNNNVYINGRPRLRNTTLVNSAANGATTIAVASATGWSVGDRLMIQSEQIANYTSNTVGVLSATFIQAINGNTITISPGLNVSRSAGTVVSNFTSNVTVKSWNPVYASYGIYLGPSTPSSVIDINNIKIEGMGNGITTTHPGHPNAFAVGWTSYSYTGVRNSTAQTGTPLGGITVNNNFSQIPGFTMKGLIAENPIGAIQNYSYHILGKAAEFITLDDCVAFAPNANGYFCNINSQASVTIKNCASLRAGAGIFLANSVPNKVNVDNCYIDATNPFSATLNGLILNVTNSKIRGTSYLFPLDALQSGTIKNCNLFHINATGSVMQTNVNASGSLNISNCNLYLNASSTNTLLSAFTKNTVALSNKTAQTAEVTVFQANGNLNDYRRFNYYHYSQADFTVRNRGTSSYRIKPEIANVPFYNYFTLGGTADTPQRFKGSLRFNDNYSKGYPPSININGAGVDYTFTCEPTANTWQPFDVTLTPNVTDDITLTITCQSSATTGFVWFDGFPIFPYIKNVRHYGFVFDKNVDRTVDSLTTLTENQVSALAIVNNLDYLYDAACYWSVTNLSATSYIDLFTANGATLDFGNKNIIINSDLSTGFAYSTASNTMIIASPSLSAGTNFNAIKTTGTINLSAGTLSDIDVNASIVQDTPTSLKGVYMLNAAKTYTYNTNTATEVEFEDCNIYGLRNVGNAIVTVKKTGTTAITESDAEVVTYAPTLINLPDLALQEAYVALYDNTSTRRYYQNVGGTLVLPASATGAWTYKIARYGYEFVSGTFNVNPATGGTVDINPNYVPDSFITQADSTIVAAYTDLNSTARIHDYISYIRTTSAGIDYGALHSQSFGTLSFNYGLTLDATAASVFAFNGSVITLKSTAIEDDIIYFVDGNFTQSNGNTLSDGIKVRADNTNSEFYFANVDSLIFYPTENDRNNNTNPGITIADETTIYRFLYGGYTNGVTLSGNSYIRVTVTGTTLLNTTPINQGSNSIDFGDTGNIQVILNNQKIMNQGIQKASKLIPHSTNI